eukprot:m.407078 g.407078  ORF g.407078 m.407078 type:complete len:60 (-) comp56504_c4_seq6:1116-1295(-)
MLSESALQAFDQDDGESSAEVPRTDRLTFLSWRNSPFRLLHFSAYFRPTWQDERPTSPA